MDTESDDRAGAAADHSLNKIYTQDIADEAMASQQEEAVKNEMELEKELRELDKNV